MGPSLRGTDVLVMGMGRSGQAAAALARELGARVRTTDLRADAPTVEGCEAIHGEHRERDFEQAELVVVSPGIPAASPLLRRAERTGARVLGELAFGLEQLPLLPVLAVTGTNGKSSTTWYLGQLLAAAGRRAFVGGNLGHPLSDLTLRHLRGEAEARATEVLVLEVSSYQLELPGELSPLAACVLNLTPDHFGRHGDMAGYAAAKRRLFEQMAPAARAWIAADGGPCAAMAEGLACRVCWLGGSPGVLHDEAGMRFSGVADEGALSWEGLSLLGAHNRDNVAAATALALSYGLRREQIALRALSALPHRLELVHEAEGVRWINDSKATNVDAALVGLRAIEGPTIVLLGGEGKAGADYLPLAAALGPEHRLVTFGASGPEIGAALGGTGAPTLAAAVALARSLARPGHTVLLSPACASFDEFRDFEHRGRAFTEYARGGTLGDGGAA
jgi:UDP-N-acetylmuramoylalanine--D-glutamate ligase